MKRHLDRAPGVGIRTYLTRTLPLGCLHRVPGFMLEAKPGAHQRHILDVSRFHLAESLLFDHLPAILVVQADAIVQRQVVGHLPCIADHQKKYDLACRLHKTAFA